MSYSRTCTVRITDEVNCIFTGIHPDHVGYFYEEYGIHAPNYYFNPKFKLGAWDGKIRYFHKTGKTYVNLLDEIIPTVIGLKYKVEVKDERTSRAVSVDTVDKDFFKHIMDPETDEPWEMRDYQIGMINALTDGGGGVGICGTGGGKTSMCAALALLYERAADYRSIIIVPDKNLSDQTRDEYSFFELDVGEYSGERKDIKHKHIVSTWQALQNNPKIIQDFDVVIVDEAHGLRGNVLTKLLNEHGRKIAYRFGVTGTLPKAETDAMSVKVAVGPVRYTISAADLIRAGHLAKLHIDIVQLEVDFKDQYAEYLDEFEPTDTEPKPMTYRKFKDTYFPDFQAEKRFHQSEPDRMQWIANHIEKKRDAGKGNVLCLVDGVRFGRKLAKMVEGAVFLSGKDKMKDRKEVYNLFKDNDNLVVIATVQIASTGLNIKRIFNMMFIDVGKSFIRVIQTIGRGLRKAPDKDFVDVTDLCSDLKYSRKHAQERIKFYKEAEYPHKKRIVDYAAELRV
jgi:superfamily II DNA or RNA helicase